jgi:proline dehydrogenase
MENLVADAARHGNFVRIDMEDTNCTQITIDLYLKLRKQFNNVGLVLQAYLRRTQEDAVNIIEAGAGHFRLCKGIYVEPRWLAYQLPDLINQNYLEVLETMIEKGAYVGIATHDERLVWGALKLIRKYGLQKHQYEFQMLLGVDPELRDMLVAAGHHVRVYVPYGQEWHGYCLRRFKENPKIAGYILENFFESLR